MSYYLVAAEDGVLAALGLFETAAGADAAVALASDWFRGEWGSFRPLPPEVIAGEVVAQAVATSGRIAERRRLGDRRGGLGAGDIGPDIGPAIERRGGLDRRVGVELQAVV